MSVRTGMPADQPPVTWRKSRRSNPSGNCVEVAALPGGGIALRDSREPAGLALVWTSAQMRAFLAEVKRGGFDGLR